MQHRVYNERMKAKSPKKQQQPGDYRIFVGAFPTGTLAETIQTVRQKYDAKTAAITAPHVTLAGTYWRSGPATAVHEAAAITQLQTLTRTLSPFSLTLGGIHTFGGRVVYLGVALTPELLAVRDALLGILGPDKHGRRFTPHLTLAMRLNRQAAAQMVAALRQEEWEYGRFPASISTLHLMQRGPNDPDWRTIAAIPLD